MIKTGVVFSVQELREKLGRQPLPGEGPAGHQPAAVLVPLFCRAAEPHLLFTRRTLHLRNHQGQISFPGGVYDPGDPDLTATALRETAEELGLHPDLVEVLGWLPPVATVTGYWINPVVGQIPYPCEFRPNHREVAQILTFPVTAFFPPERWSTGDYTYEGQHRRVCCWKWGDTVIWGATARILLQFLELLGERPVPPGET